MSHVFLTRYLPLMALPILLPWNTPLLAQSAPCTIETVVAVSPTAPGDGGPAIDAELLLPDAARIGPDGLLYIADTGYRRIRRVTGDGRIETFAGNGSDVVSGDGGPALQAGLREPTSLAFGPDGSLYFIDGGSRIRKIALDGTITTIAGGKASGYVGDGGPAVDASLRDAFRLAFGPDGSLYVVSQEAHRVRRIRPDGNIEAVAGVSHPYETRFGSSGNGGPALEAYLNNPRDIAVDSKGSVYVLDSRGSVIRRVSPDGIIQRYLGQGGLLVEDGTLRESFRMRASSAVAIDGQDRLYWVDDRSIVRRIGTDDRVETVWNPGTAQPRAFHLSVTAHGTPYVVRAEQVLRISTDGEPTVLAGVGREAQWTVSKPALEAGLFRPTQIAHGSNGEIYVMDAYLASVWVLRNGRVEHFAGTGNSEIAGDGGPAKEASFLAVTGLAAGTENVFISDVGRIRRVASDGTISTYAGNGEQCRRGIFFPPQCGDGGPATDAHVSSVRDMEVDSMGNLYVLHAESGYSRQNWIRKVTPDGVISTIPDNVPLDDFRGSAALAIAADPDDNLVFSRESSEGRKLMRATPEGEIQEIGGAGGFLATTAAMAADSAGNVYFSDTGRRVLRVTPEGAVDWLIPNQSNAGFSSGDGGPPGQATVEDIQGLAVDDGDNLYLADSSARRIRRINKVSSCPFAEPPVIAFSGIVNAASSLFTLPAPGTIISIYGVRLGPQEGIPGRIESGRFTTELVGVRVLVDGVPAPLLYVSSSQINAVTPYATEIDGVMYLSFSGGFPFFWANRFSLIQVEYEGVLSGPEFRSITPARPGIFELGGGRAAAINENGFINGPEHPVTPGSWLSLYATGEGLTNPPGVDGQITGATLAEPMLPVEVTLGGEPVTVLYAGAAPGLVAGVFQVNILIPPTFQGRGPRQIRLKVGDFENLGQNATIVVGP